MLSNNNNNNNLMTKRPASIINANREQELGSSVEQLSPLINPLAVEDDSL